MAPEASAEARYQGLGIREFLGMLGCFWILGKYSGKPIAGIVNGNSKILKWRYCTI
jgi:hypothetical protein